MGGDAILGLILTIGIICLFVLFCMAIEAVFFRYKVKKLRGLSWFD